MEASNKKTQPKTRQAYQADMYDEQAKAYNGPKGGRNGQTELDGYTYTWHKPKQEPTNIHYRRSMHEMDIDTQFSRRASNLNIATRPRLGSRQHLRQTSPQKCSPDKPIFRSTYSATSIAPTICGKTSKQKLATVINRGMRQSYDCHEFMNLHEGSSQRSKELSSIEQTLNNLSCKIFNAKKQLQKKNDKNKQLKNFEPRYIILEQEEDACTIANNLDQESEISRESSNTVKKTPVTRISSLVQSVPRSKEVHGFAVNPYSPRRHNIYYVSQIVRAINDRTSIAREHLCGSMKILKYLENEELPIFTEIESKRVNLPKKDIYKGKKTIIFDLDETLIHCNENAEANSDVTLTIKMQNGETIDASINIRPYAITLLNNLYRHFELIVFTASHSCYANVVLDYLDPDKVIFQHRLYRQHCCLSEKGMYIKDLRIINRNLSEVVLVDNAAYSYAFQLENGIPILPYYEGTNDFQLKALEPYLLEKVAHAKDVRELNKKTFKLHHYGKYESPETLVEQLYKMN